MLRWLVPPGGKQISIAVDARADFLVGQEFAAVERIESPLHRFDETRFLIQIISDHGLRSFFRISPGELGKFSFLFRSQMNDHILQSRKVPLALAILSGFLRADRFANWTSLAKFASILICEFKQPIHEHHPK
jgi:hypothetical protein